MRMVLRPETSMKRVRTRITGCPAARLHHAAPRETSIVQVCQGLGPEQRAIVFRLAGQIH